MRRIKLPHPLSMPSGAKAWRLRRAAAAALVLLSCSETSGPRTVSVPAGVTVVLVNPTSARVTWTANPAEEEVATYNVIRNGVKLGETSGTTYLDETLSQLETYRYSVSANGPDGIVSAASAESPGASVTAPDVTPPQVSAVAPLAGAKNVSVSVFVSA